MRKLRKTHTSALTSLLKDVMMKMQTGELAGTAG